MTSSLQNKALKKILIIEDDPIVVRLYQSRLERDGYNVISATDGQIGFYSVYDEKPDAVILDLMLPKMNGLDILKKFRAQKQFESLPIFILSNEFAKDLTREAKEAGATEIFEKSKMTPNEMMKALARVFFNASDYKTLADKAAQPAPIQTKIELPLPPPAIESIEEAHLETSFLASSKGSISRLREILLRLVRTKERQEQLKFLNELLEAAHLLSGNAATAGQRTIAQDTAALEAYIHELCTKPQEINASAMRTICQGIDFICTLLTQAKDIPLPPESGLVLVVDDEPLSRRAAKLAVERAGLKTISVSSSEVALQILSENAFDLIVMDVQMPGMDGFALCAELRKLSAHKATPVIFVTSQNDFESRIKSTASGGNDFIAKPFLLMELALKAMILRSTKKA